MTSITSSERWMIYLSLDELKTILGVFSYDIEVCGLLSPNSIPYVEVSPMKMFCVFQDR